MFWSRKVAPVVHDRHRQVGVDLTATRLRASSIGVGRPRVLLLDGAADHLLLFVNLDRRTPEIGQIGYTLCRRLPHAVCSNFLPQLGLNRVWQAGRNRLTAEAALHLAFQKVAEPIRAEAEAVALALPTYLSPAQIKSIVEIAGHCRWPLRGTVAAPLAVVAHRLSQQSRQVESAEAGDPEHPATADHLDGRPDWVVPLRIHEDLPGTATAIVVVDADDHALSAAVVTVSAGEIRLVGHANWPRLSAKVWKDRLLDALADRCVRLCRRDPRDSAEAEQALFEQLDDALERTRYGQSVCLTVRSSHWYQDLPQRSEDFDGYCANLAVQAGVGLQSLVSGITLEAPPRSLWLTPAAARLPGLAEELLRHSSEQAEISLLPGTAVAEAAASLIPRWLSGELPRAHLDTVIPRAALPAPARGNAPAMSQNATTPLRKTHFPTGS